MEIQGWLVVVAVAVVVALIAAELLLRSVRPKLRPLSDWRNWEIQHKVEALDALARDGGASVVAVGSSTMNAAVEPDFLSKLTGRTRPAFNAALNGAGTRLIELWVLRILLPRLRPDVVVIGLGSGDVNAGNIVASDLLRSFLSAPAWEDLTKGSTPMRWMHLLERKSLLVRYRRYLGRSSLFQPDPFQRASVCRRLGLLRWFLVFRYRPYKIEDRQLLIWKDSLNEFEVGREEIEALGRLVDELRAAGVIPIIVKTPVTKDWVDLHPAGFKAFEEALESMVRDRDVIYADLMAPFTSIEDFADPVHVNGNGQERFTKLLAEVIADIPASSTA